MYIPKTPPPQGQRQDGGLSRQQRRRVDRQIEKLKQLLSEIDMDDARWFALHPERRFRLRPLVPGEPFLFDAGFVPPPGWAIWLIARKLAPGVRSKHTICVDPEIAADAVGSDSVVRAMFELMVVNTTGKMVTTHQVCQLAQKYAREKMN